MSDKLRVGIVGCGLVAEGQHIPSFIRLKRNVVLQAVCDKNENLASSPIFLSGCTQEFS